MMVRSAGRLRLNRLLAGMARLGALTVGLLLLVPSPTALLGQTPVAATMISPTPGSTFNSSTVTFTWTPGTGVTAYWLSLGTNGPTGANFWESGKITATSAAVPNIPINGVTMYVTIFSMINGAWKPVVYSYKESAVPIPAAITSPTAGTALPGSSATFKWTPGAGVSQYFLSLGTNGPTGANLWESGATTATSVTAKGLPTGASTWGTMDAWLQCGTPAVSTTLTTGVLSSCTLGNSTGGFSMNENPLTPMAVATTRGALGAAVTVAGTSYTASAATKSLSYNHAYELQYFNFNLPSTVSTKVLNMNGYITFAPPNTGADRDYYYDYLDAQDPEGFDAFVIQLHSGLYQGCTYCVFLETNPGWVTTHSSAGIALTPGTRYAFSVQANESTGVASLAIYNATTFEQVGSTITSPSATGSKIANILVGNVEVGTASGYTSYFEDLMLDWSQHQSFPNIPHGSSATTIYATLFSMINGAWKPMVYTYSPGGSAPEAPAAPTLSGLSCASGSLVGTSTDSCTVTMSGAVSAATTVTLSSNNSAVTVPATVTVAANATTATFSASVAAVSAAESATLTADQSGSTKTFGLTLNADVPILTVSTGALTFGSVVLNTPLTQTVTLSSTGALPVTVSSVKISGTGFSLGSLSLPVTLNSGQSLTLDVLFAPLLAVLDSGTLTITSNSSAGSTVNVSLSGTGASSAYQVNLAWNAPTNPPVTIAGYNVYRATAGSASYTQVNTSVDASTSFTDTTVQTGTTYDYYIESVDTQGASSAPSTVLGVTVP